MAQIYKKNSKNIYVLSLYQNLNFWFSIDILFTLSLILLNKFFYISTLKNFAILTVVIFFVFRFLLVLNRLKKSKSILNYLKERQAEKAITRALLATMTLNRLQDSPFVQVPTVRVGVDGSEQVGVVIEKLPGMYEIEKLVEDINSSLRNSLANFAVTSGIITDNGLFYEFILEDVERSKIWRPFNIDEFKTGKYILKLQEDLFINISERPHLSVWGRTGSRKTSEIFSLVLELFAMGADVRFLDFKMEFSAFETFYPKEKIASNIDDVFVVLDDVLQILNERQELMSFETKKRKKIGLKASDIDLRPIVLVADEVGSIVAQMDNKQLKDFNNKLVTLIQKGRSVGISIFISTQDPSTDTLPQKIRNQFSTKILLGSSNSDIQRMAFGEAAFANIENGQGLFTSDGITKQPEKFYVTDIYTNGFNELKTFEKLYKYGQTIEYRE